MPDVLADYEIQTVKRPKLFWIVFILYLAQVLAANLTNTMVVLQVGLAEIFYNYKAAFILLLLDVFELFLLYSFFRGRKISCFAIPLVQGIYAAIFLKKYYMILSPPAIPHADIILSDHLSIFFCINAVLIVALILQPLLMNYFRITRRSYFIILALTFTCMMTTLLLFYNDTPVTVN